MLFKFRTQVLDDDLSILAEHPIEVYFPPVTANLLLANEAKNMILGEGQINIAEMAKQAAMHCIWHAAKELADRQARVDLDEAAPTKDPSAGKDPTEMPLPEEKL